MIAYNKTLLDNVYLDEEADNLKQAGFISSDQYQNFSKSIPKLKSQKNIFVRIGFFILGCMLYASISGFLSLILFVNDGNDYIYFIYFFALMGFGIKELMSSKMDFFGFGLDDAFILGAISTLLVAIGISTEQNYNPSYLLILVVMAIVSSIAYFRYLNILLVLFACVGLFGSIGYAVFQYLIIGKTILPFVYLLLSGGVYFMCKKTIHNLTAPYYYNGLKLVQSFCLVLFYIAGNYFVVREVNASLAEEYYSVSPEIPFALLFWVFTFATPVAYVLFALKNKDRVMLWIGFVALGFSFLSFRAYYYILPPEIALTVGGLVLFCFTYFAIKKTKFNETGITFKLDRFTNPSDFAHLQTLVVASQFGIDQEVKTEQSPMEFGGGEYSGGGSTGEF